MTAETPRATLVMVRTSEGASAERALAARTIAQIIDDTDTRRNRVNQLRRDRTMTVIE